MGKLKEIIENLSLVVRQVVTEEIKVREMLFKNHRIEVEDRVFGLWAYSLTRGSSLQTGAIKLWSDLRLGVELGMVPGLEIKDVNEILVLSRPNFVQKYFGAALTANERDVRRAELVRKHLASRGV